MDSENLVTDPGAPQAPVAKKVKSGKTQGTRPRNVRKRGKVLPGLLPGLPLNIVFVMSFPVLASCRLVLIYAVSVT